MITGVYIVEFFTLNSLYMNFSFCSFVPFSKRLGTLIFIFLLPILAHSQSTYGTVFDFSCSDQYVQLQGASVSALTSSPNGITFTDQNISISGPTFTVDRNITFIRCKVRMESGAEIITSGNVTFRAEQTVFTGCSSAWKGVTIGTGCVLRLHQTLFRDVTGGAISFLPGYKTTLTNRITNCVFVNTRVGISAQSFGSAPINLSPMLFSGNRFLEESTIYSGAPRQVRHTGIQLNFCTAEIGRQGTLNTFSGTFEAAAIRIQNSDIRLSNCRFQDVTSSNNIIDVRFSRLIMRKENTWQACDFQNNTSAVCINVRNNRGLEIIGNTFTNTIGIQGTVVSIDPSTIYSSVIIRENTFSIGNAFAGIRLSRSISDDPFSPESIIEDNIFTKYGNAPCAGVILIESQFNSYSQLYIQNNHITFLDNESTLTAIFIQGSDFAISRDIFIQYNWIHFNGQINSDEASAMGSFGIGIQNINPFLGLNSATNSEISLNTIDAMYYDDECSPTSMNPEDNCFSPILCGIHLYKSLNMRVFGNHVKNTFRDFHFFDLNLNCDFRCNEMGFAHTGLNCQNSTNMSNQFLKSNFWLANSTGYRGAGAYYWTTSANGNGTQPVTTPLFRFFVNPDLPDHAPAVFAPANWFIPLDQEEKCSGTKGGGVLESWIDGILPPHYIDVLNGHYNDRLSEAEKWDTDRELIVTLRRIPQSVDSSVLAYNWLQQQQNSSAQMYTDMERTIYDVISPTPNVAVYQKEIERLMKTFATLNELAFTPQADSLAITIQINLVADSIAKYRAEILLADNLHRSSIIAQLDYLENQIPNLPDTALYEVARKKILNWTIQRFKGDTFSASQITEQVNIADGCFDLYGQSTLDAIRFLPDEHTKNYIGKEDRKICSENRIGNSANKQAQCNLTIWPNPATNWIEVLIPEAYRNNEAVLRVTSLDGGGLWSSQISGDVIRIPLSNFPSGIYLICLSAKGMPHSFEKLIKSR